MPNYEDLLVRVEAPAIAPLAPSQDTTSDQLSFFHRPSPIPFVRHSPLPVASSSPTNAVANNASKAVVKTVIQSTGSAAGVSSINGIAGALLIASPLGTLVVTEAGPDVNIDLSTPVSVAHGGTGSSSPSLVAGTGIGISGLFPGQTVALTTPVAVANGGTGTSTPSLVAGTGIAVTGSFPNQTVATTEVLTAAAPTVSAGQVGLGNGTATSATTGANGATPGQVDGYLIINVGGTGKKIPYYNT